MTGTPGAAPVDARVRPQLGDLAAQNRRAALLPGWQHAARARQSGVSFSSMKGRGMEYAESRPYQAGDDVRALDWRLTARSGRPHTKIFREERERPVHVLLDLRASMAFATRGVFKSVQAARAAALLAWKAVHSGDRLGGVLLGNTRCEELPPARGSVAALRFLKRAVAAAEVAPLFSPATAAPGLAAATAPLRRLVKPGSLVFACSDFRDLDDDARAALAQVARHSDLLLVLCHDVFEAALPALRASLCVTDGRHDLEIELGEASLADDYAARAAARRAGLQRFCRDHGIGLATLDTLEDPFSVLQRALA